MSLSTLSLSSPPHSTAPLTPLAQQLTVTVLDTGKSFKITSAQLFRAMPPIRRFFENERSIEHVTGEVKLGDTTDSELAHFIDLASYPTAEASDFVRLYTT